MSVVRCTRADECTVFCFVRARPLGVFDIFDLPLFRSLVQQQERALPEILGGSPTGVK